ncbi:hypothetical protein B0J17DRAFT_747724 [Rhizoctonia solani]|nr:hypothetical protein B0J17DRAFT_747724 [Rhizoctonia solani]
MEFAKWQPACRSGYLGRVDTSGLRRRGKRSTVSHVSQELAKSSTITKAPNPETGKESKRQSTRSRGRFAKPKRKPVKIEFNEFGDYKNVNYRQSQTNAKSTDKAFDDEAEQSQAEMDEDRDNKFDKIDETDEIPEVPSYTSPSTPHACNNPSPRFPLTRVRKMTSFSPSHGS